MTLTPTRQEWAEDAACANHPDPDVFFRGGGPVPDAVRALCGRCAVRGKCLDLALRAESAGYRRYGIFGGLSAEARADLARCAHQLNPGTCRACRATTDAEEASK